MILSRYVIVTLNQLRFCIPFINAYPFYDVQFESCRVTHRSYHTRIMYFSMFRILREIRPNEADDISQNHDTMKSDSDISSCIDTLHHCTIQPHCLMISEFNKPCAMGNTDCCAVCINYQFITTENQMLFLMIQKAFSSDTVQLSNLG